EVGPRLRDPLSLLAWRWASVVGIDVASRGAVLCRGHQPPCRYHRDQPGGAFTAGAKFLRRGPSASPVGWVSPRSRRNPPSGAVGCAPQTGLTHPTKDESRGPWTARHDFTIMA